MKFKFPLFKTQLKHCLFENKIKRSPKRLNVRCNDELFGLSQEISSV